jgi:hypothetical protein
VQVLILSPTRELAQQTEKVILALGEYMNVQAHACIGGKSLGMWNQCPDRSAVARKGVLLLRLVRACGVVAAI